MSDPTVRLCSEDQLADLTTLLAEEQDAGRREVDRLVQAFPDDPRLHFLRGSLAAGERDYALARAEMAQAVALAPGYAIARFQFGLLLLTSGEAAEASHVLGPLLDLPDDACLRSFAQGLRHLISDEFDSAIADLERGLAQNRENEPLNHDMRMLVSEIRAKRDDLEPGQGDLSAAHLLLRQSAIKATKH